jgi:hypothetical protein
MNMNQLGKGLASIGICACVAYTISITHTAMPLWWLLIILLIW